MAIREKIDVKGFQCPVTYCMSLIGGKWKPIILFMIDNDVNRFGILNREIEGISKQMLTKQLREMEVDGLLNRTIYPEIPPRVEYSITDFGKSLFPVIMQMKEWGSQHIDCKK